MKRICKILAILLPLAACTMQEPGEDSVMMSFTAIQESAGETKTYLEDGTKVFWSSSDQISIFGSGSSKGELFSIRPEDGGKAEATFTGTIPGSAPYCALYPASETASLDGNVLSLTLPATQQFAEGGFADGANPMVAMSNGTKLQFKNLCGMLAVTLTGRAVIKSIKLTSLSQEALWGDATVDISYDKVPNLVMTSSGDESHRSITLDCGKGVSLTSSGVRFGIVIPAGTLASGFKITVTDTGGNDMVKVTGPHETVRSRVTSMAALPYKADAAVTFTNATTLGVYDLSDTYARPIKTYTRVQDQYAIRYNSDRSITFRLQSIVYNYLIAFTFPESVGSRTKVTINAYGNIGMSSGTVTVNLVKSQDNKLWLKDDTNKRGYIIASDLQ